MRFVEKSAQFSVPIRLVAWILVFIFTSTTIAQGAPAELIAPKLQTLGQRLETEISALADQITVPSDLGNITEIYKPELQNGVGSGLIVHIEDAHASDEAQVHTEAILKHLHDRYKLNTIFLEGGFGDLKPERLSFFKGPALNQKLIDALTQRGLVGGVERFLVSESLRGSPVTNGPTAAILKNRSPRPVGARDDKKNETANFDLNPAVYGVEDPSLYRENLEAFQEVYAHKSETDAYLAGIRQRILDQSAATLNKELKDFFKAWIFQEETGKNFASRLNLLGKYAHDFLELDFSDARHQIEWPMLVRFFKLKQLEELAYSEQRTADSEKRDLVDWLDAKGLSKFKSILDFLNSERSLDLRSQFEQFYAAAAPKGFRFEDYPHLTRQIGIAILSSELSASVERRPDPSFGGQITDLVRESERLNARILEKLAKTPEEQNLMKQYQEYLLLKKLFSLELSREEYGKFSARLKIDQSLSLREAISATKQSRTIHASPAPNQEIASVALLPRNDAKNESSVSKLMSRALNFYDLAQKREEVMFGKMLVQMKAQKNPNAVLVTGGFHSEGFSRYLKAHQMAYVRITPRITQAVDDRNYLKLMTFNARPGLELQTPESKDRVFIGSTARQPTLMAGLGAIRSQVGGMVAGNYLAGMNESLEAVSGPANSLSALLQSIQPDVLQAHHLFATGHALAFSRRSETRQQDGPKDVTATSGKEMTLRDLPWLATKGFAMNLSAPVIWEEQYKNGVTEPLKRIGKAPAQFKGRILVLGYGTRGFLLTETKKVFPNAQEIVGIDWDPQAYTVAKKRFLSDSKVRVRIGDATNLNVVWEGDPEHLQSVFVSDESFDLIISIGCFNSMAAGELEAAVDEAFRVMTPEGILINSFSGQSDEEIIPKRFHPIGSFLGIFSKSAMPLATLSSFATTATTGRRPEGEGDGPQARSEVRSTGHEKRETRHQNEVVAKIALARELKKSLERELVVQAAQMMIQWYLRVYVHRTAAMVFSLKGLLEHGLPEPIARFFAERKIWSKNEQSGILETLDIIYHIETEAKSQKAASSAGAKNKKSSAKLPPKSRSEMREILFQQIGKIFRSDMGTAKNGAQRAGLYGFGTVNGDNGASGKISMVTQDSMTARLSQKNEPGLLQSTDHATAAGLGEERHGLFVGDGNVFDGNAGFLDRAKVLFDGPHVKTDRFFDVFDRFLTRFSLRGATRKFGNVNGISTPGFFFEHHLVFHTSISLNAQITTMISWGIIAQSALLVQLVTVTGRHPEGELDGSKARSESLGTQGRFLNLRTSQGQEPSPGIGLRSEVRAEKGKTIFLPGGDASRTVHLMQDLRRIAQAVLEEALIARKQGLASRLTDAKLVARFLGRVKAIMPREDQAVAFNLLQKLDKNKHLFINETSQDPAQNLVAFAALYRNTIGPSSKFEQASGVQERIRGSLPTGAFETSRRDFMKLTGASMILAALFGGGAVVAAKKMPVPGMPIWPIQLFKLCMHNLFVKLMEPWDVATSEPLVRLRPDELGPLASIWRNLWSSEEYAEQGLVFMMPSSLGLGSGAFFDSKQNSKIQLFLKLLSETVPLEEEVETWINTHDVFVGKVTQKFRRDLRPQELYQALLDDPEFVRFMQDIGRRVLPIQKLVSELPWQWLHDHASSVLKGPQAASDALQTELNLEVERLRGKVLEPLSAIEKNYIHDPEMAQALMQWESDGGRLPDSSIKDEAAEEKLQVLQRAEALLRVVRASSQLTLLPGGNGSLIRSEVRESEKPGKPPTKNELEQAAKAELGKKLLAIKARIQTKLITPFPGLKALLENATDFQELAKSLERSLTILGNINVVLYKPYEDVLKRMSENLAALLSKLELEDPMMLEIKYEVQKPKELIQGLKNLQKKAEDFNAEITQLFGYTVKVKAAKSTKFRPKPSSDQLPGKIAEFVAKIETIRLDERQKEQIQREIQGLNVKAGFDRDTIEWLSYFFAPKKFYNLYRQSPIITALNKLLKKIVPAYYSGPGCLDHFFV